MKTSSIQFEKVVFFLKRFITFGVGSVIVFGMGQNCSAPSHEVLMEADLSSSSSTNFLAAKAILSKNCMSCHSPGGNAEGVPFDLINDYQFELSGLVIAGNPMGSKLIRQLKNFSMNGEKQMPPEGKLSDDDFNTLKRWILNIGKPENLYACNMTESVASKMLPTSVKALTYRQLSNTILDFLKVVLPEKADAFHLEAMSAAFFPSDSTSRYTRTSSDLSEQSLAASMAAIDIVAKRLTVGSTYAGNVAANAISLNKGSCVSSSPLFDDVCRKQIIRNIGLRLYRRPLLENNEVNEVELFKQEFLTATTPVDGLNNIIFRMMMSQNFLFHMEDQEIEISPNILQLSSYSIANRLSYTFWNSMPDEILLAKASSKNLYDQTEFSDALNYVINHPKATDSYKEFANGWLLLGKLQPFDPASSGVKLFNEGIQFDANMTKAMVAEAEELVSYVSKSGGTLKDVFTTDISFARHAPLMSLYGVAQAAPTEINSTNAVRMPAGTRSGILTRGALLAEASAGQNLIHRAVRIKRDLMCLNQLPPPANTTPPNPLTDAEFSNMTTRQKVTHNTSSSSCFACHETINPFGYALSNFNGLGFHKLTEPAFNLAGIPTGAQLPVDTTSNFNPVFGNNINVSNAFEFSELVADRPETHACFVKNYSTFFLKRDPDLNKEGCRLNKMVSLVNQSATLREAFSSLATDGEFRLRKLD